MKHVLRNDVYFVGHIGMAKLPNIQRGEVIVFTVEAGEITELVMVEEEFDPYSDDIKTVDDLIKLGYVKPLQYLELWTNK